MRRIFCAGLFAAAFAGCAQAADLADAKAPDAAPSCFSSVWNYLNSSLRDCPLSYGPFLLYGNIDGGYGYEKWGAPVGINADKPNYAIARNSGNTHWLWSPNGISTSVIGVRLAQSLGGDWEAIGVAEAGFNPFSFRLINGPQSLADNNLLRTPYQRTMFDSSRAGQWDNSQGFIGLSNPKYGTLTYGRTTSLAQGAIGGYDPVASIAFSQLGFSATYVGFGSSPTARVNSALTYRLTYRRLRFAAQAQVGGYEQGNAATEQYQALVGTDLGKLSFDAIVGFARNAANLSSYSGATLPVGYDPNSIARATLLNTGGVALLARYDWNAFKFYLGYIYARNTNPSYAYPDGLPTIAQGVVVPPGATTADAYNAPRVMKTVWTGLRYAAMKNLDLAAGVYWETQNDYLAAPSTCTGSGTATSSGKCSGGRYSYSIMAEYRPLSRISLYAGVMVSTVYGGVASGFQHAQNIDPTVGVRFRF